MQHHNDVLMFVQCVVFWVISVVMNFFIAIDKIDTVYVTPALHGLQFVSLFIAIGAGLATMSPTFKDKADGFIKRLFDRFN